MKRLLAVLMFTAMLFLLAACGAAPDHTEEPTTSPHRWTKEYGVYPVMALSGVHFTNDTAALVWQSPKVTEAPAPKELEKQQVVSGSNTVLQYEESMTIPTGVTRHYYMSADRKIECVYRADDMALLSLKLLDQDMSAFAQMGLEAYDQYIKSVVSQYYTEKWDELALTCLTYYTQEGSNYLASKVEYGFMTEFPDNGTLTAREFRYIREYDDCQTSDWIQVIVSLEERSIRIWFNEHQFDSLDVAIDHDKIDAVISEFFSNYLQPGVEMETYEKKSASLIYYGDNLVCRVNLDAIFVEDGERVEEGMSLMVDIPDAA